VQAHERALRQFQFRIRHHTNLLITDWFTYLLRDVKQVEMLQLKADNERMQRTIARNGLQDDSVEFTGHSLEGSTSATSSLQKKLSIGDPTTFGQSLRISR